MQRFRWEPFDGYISTFDDPNLVIGAREIEGKVVDVFLKRRNPDDIFERWLFMPADTVTHDSTSDEQTEIDLNQPLYVKN